MAIFREVHTKVSCDICGDRIAEFRSSGIGVSRGYAAYFARERGATAGKKVICKKCRISRRIEKKCKRCVACTSFDWEEERKRISI